MSTVQDLMGLGMPGPLANRIGNTPITQAGAGTTQTGATPIQGSFTIATTAAGQTAFIFPAAASLGRPFYIYNSTSTAAALFPTVGGNFNGGTTNAAYTPTIPANRTALFVRASATLWVGGLLATT